MRFNNLVTEVGEWSRKNFGDNNTGAGDIGPLLGVVEEIGEIEEAMLTEDYDDMVDGFADAFIFLADLFYRRGYLGHGLFWHGPPGGYKVPSLRQAVGRVCHVALKRAQGIRGFDIDGAYARAMSNALYGLFHSLLKAFEQSIKGFGKDDTPEDLIDEVWEEVKQRDWIKYAKTGLINNGEIS